MSLSEEPRLVYDHGKPDSSEQREQLKNGEPFQKQQALQPEWSECGVSRVPVLGHIQEGPSTSA